MTKLVTDDKRFLADVIDRGAGAMLDIAGVKDLPQTPAGRWAVIEALLEPLVEVQCEHCGHSHLVRGEPMISRESALELLNFDDNDPNRHKDTARIPDQ